MATKITCRVDETSFALKKIEDAKKYSYPATLVVFLKASDEAECKHASKCAFTFTDTIPEVTKATSAIVKSQIEVTLTGTAFTAGDTTGTELYFGDKKATTVSVSTTEGKFTVTDLDTYTDLKSKMKLYFASGIPKGSAKITAGVTLTPSFE